jgi:hypothetical protein
MQCEQLALRLHIRLLWGLFDSKDIPKLPEEAVLTRFKEHFLTEASLENFQARRPIVPISLVKVTSTKLGRIGAQLGLIEEHIISYIQGCLARFGMTSWCPDLRETAYSLYNSACRIIALDTFKQAVISHAYAGVQPKLDYVKDMQLLMKIYDHIVHQFFYSRWRRDVQRPGSVAAADETNPAYKARNRVSVTYRSLRPPH